jgi:hypothetical protein
VLRPHDYTQRPYDNAARLPPQEETEGTPFQAACRVARKERKEDAGYEVGKCAQQCCRTKSLLRMLRGVKTRACEFPCDNDELHEGSWRVLENHGGEPVRYTATVSSMPPPLPAEYLEAFASVEPERHESGMRLRAVDSELPAALAETVAWSEEIAPEEEILSVVDLETFEPDEVVGALGAVVVSVEAAECVFATVVDELAPAAEPIGVSVALIAPPPLPVEEQAASDEFVQRLTRVLADVGGDHAAQRLRETLRAPSAEIAPLLSAWKGILDCESDDLSACGGQTLDEFAAQLAASALEQPERQTELRRALRSAGIAAFGLLDAA